MRLNQLVGVKIVTFLIITLLTITTAAREHIISILTLIALVSCFEIVMSLQYFKAQSSGNASGDKDE